MLLNDAVAEKAARAIHEIGYGPLACRAAARACLEATLPDVVERCAKEAEDTQVAFLRLHFMAPEIRGAL